MPDDYAQLPEWARELAERYESATGESFWKILEALEAKKETKIKSAAQTAKEKID